MAARDPGNGGAHAMSHDDDPRDRGLGELVKDLAGQTSTLVRQEIKLAQAEVTQKGKLAGKQALQSATPPVPQTVETVKEDIQWAKTQTGSAAK